MAPKVFITGATGYIGGDALYAIHHKHPDWEYSALVRNSDKGAQVASQYPKIRMVYGDLDSAAVLEEEAKKADIVLHFASADHAASASAIAKGLAQGHTAASPGFWIHTSGTGILLFHDMDRDVFGDSHPKVYDDVKDIDEMNSLPDHALHREVDKVIQAAASDAVRTAIVCPPTIYDCGRGPGNQRSIQIPGLVRAMLDSGKAFHVGEGKTFWGNVHVHDLSDAYLLLAEAAAAGGGKASWGHEGYYFAENGEHVWGDVSKDIADRLFKKGLIKSASVTSLTKDQANEAHTAGAFLFGANSRARASRLREELGWKPAGRPLEATLDDVVADEQASKEKGKPPVQHV